jgi:phosphate transport system substrate-binding protein
MSAVIKQLPATKKYTEVLMKKVFVFAIICLLTFSALTACSGNKDGFNANHAISVVSREDGSGTRGAFIELFGVEVKADDGSKTDMTTVEAITADKTAIMMTNIANDPYAIGYISLGSLNDTVKALDIDGVTASTANIKNGAYAIQRPFNIAVKNEASGLAKDFIDFILAKEGQEVIGKDYVAVDEYATPYAGNKPVGRIVVAGSSSVTPVMQKLKEAYTAINAGANIEIQETDSSAGMTAAINGSCDIGMASRALKDSELAELSEIAIAIDGIAVIVNNQNPLTGLAAEQVKNIFTGSIVKWNDVQE